MATALTRRLLLGLILALPTRVLPQSPDTIQQISIRRTACFGTCPIYDFTLTRRGRATFNGVSWAPMDGRYRATIDSADFALLARTLAENGFFTLDTAYVQDVTDMPTTFICARFLRLTRCIRYYGGIGPSPIARLEAAIDSVRPKLRWKRIAVP
jgi:uncharacterized protein DUF6438